MTPELRGCRGTSLRGVERCERPTKAERGCEKCMKETQAHYDLPDLEAPHAELTDHRSTRLSSELMRISKMH